MKSFDTSSLWRISEFRKASDEGRLDLASDVDRPTVLPTTLLADLRRLHADGENGDVLEVFAACLEIARRHCCTLSRVRSCGP
jgi:hypothetical protein